MAYIDRINPDLAAGRFLFTEDGFVLKDPTAPQSDIPLKEKADKLISYLEKGGYEQDFITRMKRGYDLIISNNAPRNLENYNALVAPDRKEAGIIGHWLAYDFYDILPVGPRLFRSSYDDLNSHYRDIIDAAMKSALKSGLGRLTVSVEASNTANFFLYLQKKGIKDISNVEERTVLRYVSDNGSLPQTSYRIGLFLRRYAVMTGDDNILRILPFFPKERVMGKVFDAFTKSDRAKLEEFITASDCPLSKRDRAVVALLLYTGMRSTDIKNLNLSNIDWAKSSIKFTQGKTGVEVILPLRPFVGNCIWDYIHNERPKCDDTHCFISTMKYGNRHCGLNIGSVINAVYDRIGIRQDGERKGCHLLRHSFADEMMNQGSDITIVAKTLGHLHPNTTLGYLSANIEQLRSCALSIECFPVTHILY